MSIGDRRNRGKCLNAFCACTGACYEAVADKVQSVITDWKLNRIMRKSDEQIWREALQEFGSEEAALEAANKIRQVMLDAINKATPPKEKI